MQSHKAGLNLAVNKYMYCAMLAMLSYVACILDNMDNKKDDYHVWCYDGSAHLCGLHPG